jgi:hypothetical protein
MKLDEIGFTTVTYIIPLIPIKSHIVDCFIYGGFLKWGYPNSWMVYFKENPSTV